MKRCPKTRSENKAVFSCYFPESNVSRLKGVGFEKFWWHTYKSMSITFINIFWRLKIIDYNKIGSCSKEERVVSTLSTVSWLRLQIFCIFISGEKGDKDISYETMHGTRVKTSACQNHRMNLKWLNYI